MAGISAFHEALDAALAAGFPCGGWCPEGRMAEDGAMPPRYPLTELPGAECKQRTKRNVMDSDGTLVIYLGELSCGAETTVRYCEQLLKPVLLVDSAAAYSRQAVTRLVAKSRSITADKVSLNASPEAP